jgi:hypothetical protein
MAEPRNDTTGKSVEQYVLEEIETTGYPTEIVAASILDSRGWSVLHNPSYFDDEQEQSREFDIRAYRRRKVEFEEQEYNLDIYLVIECKKSADKPWVFFTTPQRYDISEADYLLPQIKARGYPNGILYGSMLDQATAIEAEKLLGAHHYFKQPRIARTYFEASKGKGKDGSDKTQRIYTAVMSVMKAVLFLKKGRESNTLGLLYPTIIVNGKMFEAEVALDKSVTITPREHIQLSHRYIQGVKPNATSQWSRPVQYVDHEFIVDVVSDRYLETFLRMIEGEQDTLAVFFTEALQNGLLHLESTGLMV